ncbi:MAG: hypothetical protein ACKO2O_07595 [Crocinitomicaceae bacterium]
MKKVLSYTLLACMFFMQHLVFAQQKWKKFESKDLDYSFELPWNFNEGAIVAGGIIVYYVDTNMADVSIFVESGNNETPIDSLFLEHKENYSFISREFLQKDYFIISGEENSFGKFYAYEKCVFKNGSPNTLRIFYPKKNKRYMETLIPKIGASFK